MSSCSVLCFDLILRMFLQNALTLGSRVEGSSRLAGCCASLALQVIDAEVARDESSSIQNSHQPNHGKSSYAVLVKDVENYKRALFCTHLCTICMVSSLQANQSVHSLARALYMRTLNAVVKRANSSRRTNHNFSPSNSSTESNGQGT